MELNKIIDEYGHNKNELDILKKVCDDANRNIKNILVRSDLTEYSTDEYTVKLSISKRETVNEELLLGIAHKHGLNDIIKTKEYIDFDAMEDAIYKNKISEDVLAEMSSATESKEVQTLRISKNKK